MTQEAINQILEPKQTAAPHVSTEQSTDASSSQAASNQEQFSPKIEALIRREAQALAREQAAKSYEQRIKDYEANLKQREVRLQDFDSIKANPKKALEWLGLDYNQLSQAYLNDGQVPPEVGINKLRDEMLTLKRESEEKELLRQEEAKKQAAAQETQVISDFKSEIKQYISDNKARYELIEFEGAQDDVFELIDEHYKRTIAPETGTGRVMDIKEAADKIEEYLEKREFDRKKLTKIQAIWNSLPQAAKEQALKEATKLDPKPQSPRTLTNDLSAQRVQRNPLRKPDDERVKDIVAQFIASKRPA